MGNRPWIPWWPGGWFTADVTNGLFTCVKFEADPLQLPQTRQLQGENLKFSR